MVITSTVVSPITLCRASGIPARAVSAFAVEARHGDETQRRRRNAPRQQRSPGAQRHCRDLHEQLVEQAVIEQAFANAIPLSDMLYTE